MRWLVTALLLLATGCTSQPKTPLTEKLIADNSISQTVNNTVYVLLFNPRTGQEGIYTIYWHNRNKVLAFESFEDANRFSRKLIRQDFPAPIVEAIDAKEIEKFCRTNDYDYELVPQGKEIVPPLDNGEWSSKKRTICNSQRCFPR